MQAKIDIALAARAKESPDLIHLYFCFWHCVWKLFEVLFELFGQYCDFYGRLTLLFIWICC